MFKFASAALLISTFALAHAATTTDPLVEKMVGVWTGEGERVQLASGHHIKIQTHTVSTLQGDKVFSHNEITETDASAQIKTYDRDYWLRPQAGHAGAYDLGVEEKVTSQGHFDGGILEVEQNLGGTPAYVVRSRTQFDAQGSLYEENIWFGDTELSQTRIRYHR